MFCDKCGTENRDEAEFCTNCGNKLARDNVTPVGPSRDDSRGEEPEGDYISRFISAVSDRYEVVREIGRGGMAIVFLAKDTRLERKVALKLLPQEIAMDKNFTERFIREAKIAAQLAHPNIIQIHDVDKVGEFTFYSMSFIEGISLADIIKKGGALSPKVLTRLGIQICFALQQAHEKDVIHRDIKPENILINRKRMPIVVDFGIARAMSDSRLSSTGMFIGTPQYMSPEQIQGTEVDARSDIYSMGVMLYEMATGAPPFKGMDTAALMYKHVHETPTPPHELNSRISEPLSAVIMKALEKKPEDRVQSAMDLGRMLHEITKSSAAATTGQNEAEAAPVEKQDDEKKADDDGAGKTMLMSKKPKSMKPADEEEEEKTADGGTIEMKKPVKKQQTTEEEEKRGTPMILQALLIAGLLSIAIFGSLKLLQKPTETIPITAAGPDRQASAPAADESPSPDEGQSTREEAETPQPSSAQPQPGPRAEPTPAAENTTPAPEQPSREAPPVERRTAPAPEQRTPAPSTATARESEPPAPVAPPARERPRTVEAPSSEDPAASRETPAGTVEEEQPAPPPATSPTVSRNASQAAASAPVSEPEQTEAPEPAAEPSGRPAGSSTESETGLLARRVEPETSAPAPTPEPAPATPATSTAIYWVSIPGGTFEMGDFIGDLRSELLCQPVHRVTVSPFEMSRDEITVAQYKVFIAETGHPEPPQWRVQLMHPKRPVIYVSWHDANAFAGWLDARLPTEAEWEFAARGGMQRQKYPWGSEPPAGRANLGNEWGNDGDGWRRHLQPPGTFPANPYGLNDMAGNVWEWTADRFGPYQPGLAVNPAGAPAGNLRVMRGGAWNSTDSFVRNAVRGPSDPNFKGPHVGFRVTR